MCYSFRSLFSYNNISKFIFFRVFFFSFLFIRFFFFLFVRATRVSLNRPPRIRLIYNRWCNVCITFSSVIVANSRHQKKKIASHARGLCLVVGIPNGFTLARQKRRVLNINKISVWGYTTVYYVYELWTVTVCTKTDLQLFL